MTQAQRDALDAILRSSPLDLAAPLDGLRPLFDEMMSMTPLAEGATVRARELGGVTALEISPHEGVIDDTSTILYFHGGAFVAGSARSSIGFASEISRRTGVRVVSVDYKLAPEHPFPAALEDAVSAYRGLLEAGVPSANIALFGESAGGNLAASLLLAIKQDKLPMPASAVLVSPWMDLGLTGRSFDTKSAHDPALTENALRSRAVQYLGSVLPTDPLASPSFADLTGLPPLLVQAGSNEILLSDALTFGARAAEHEVDVTIQITGGVPHVFPSFFPILEEAERAMDSISRFYRDTLRG